MAPALVARLAGGSIVTDPSTPRGNVGAGRDRPPIREILAAGPLLGLALAAGLAVSPPGARAEEPSAGPTRADLGLPKIVAISAGYNHHCLLGGDGSVWCWGDNQYGQLGIGTIESAVMPVRVEGLPDRIRQVVAFDESTCAVTESGGAWCWGHNGAGELGDGTRENRFAPTAVLGLGSGIAKLAGANSGINSAAHMCAIKVDGSGTCWGLNYDGDLGDGTSDERVGPVRVSVTNEKLVAMATAADTTCAITVGGAVRCWGRLWSDPTGKTEEGSRADLSAVTPLGLGSGVSSLVAISDSACALMASGEVRCWSWGNALPFEASSAWSPGPVPEAVTGLPGNMEVVQLNETAWYVRPSQAAEDLRVSISGCATRGDRAWCWGDNHAGQLGDGTTTDRPSPIQVQTGGIAQLTLRPGEGMALLRDGSLVMWGNDDPTPRSPFGLTLVPAQPATTAFREPDTLVPAITTHIPTPADISTDPPVVGANLLFAALAMIAFTIATELLNRRLGQVEPLLARRLRPIGQLDQARARLDAALIGRFDGAGHARRANAMRILGIAAFYGIVFALLDPTWNPLSVTGLWLVLIMAVAFGLIGLSGDIAAWAAGRRWGVASELALKPGSLVAAVASTLFSRAFVLVPGVMIGSPEALEIDEERVDRRRLGRIAGVGLGTVLAVGLAAWLATLGTTAFRGGGELLDGLLGGVEAFLLLVFAAAVQNGFVQLLSVRESAGRALRRTHRVAWAIALLGVTFVFWHTLVNPRGDLAEALGSTNVQAFLATVGIVLAVAVVVWAAPVVGRRRAVRSEPSVEGPAPATDATPAPAPSRASALEGAVSEAPVSGAPVHEQLMPTMAVPGVAASDECAGAPPAESTPPTAGAWIAETTPEPPPAAVPTGR